MIDFLLGAIFIGLLVRGWMRGLVREVIGLAVIVVGIFLAFRLSEPAGSLVAAMAGTSADVSRYIGGVAVFLLISVGGAVISFVVHKGIRFLPGLTTMNRVGGAGFAGMAGLLAATVGLSLIALLPLSGSWQQRLDESTIAGFLTEPDGLPQTVMGFVGGDGVVATVLDLENLVGERHLVGSASSMALPPADQDELRHAKKASRRLYDLVNESRVDAGTDPLARSDVLDDLAVDMAFDLYTSGRFRLDLDVEGRVEAAGLPVVEAAEVIGLGATPGSVHEGFLDEPRAVAALEAGGFRRVGVAAVRGPLGLVTVVLLAA